MHREAVDIFKELHAPDQMENWEWQLRDSNTIAMVSIPQEKTKRTGGKINMAKLSRYYIPSTAFLFAITTLAVTGHIIGSSWMTMVAIAGVILYIIMWCIDKDTNMRNSQQERGTSYLYLDIPWGYSGVQPTNLARNTLEAQRLTDVLNEAKWMVHHGSTEEERERAGSIYDSCTAAITTKPSLFPGGNGIYSGFLEKEETKEAFKEILSARDKRLSSSSPAFYDIYGHQVHPTIIFTREDGSKMRVELENANEFELVYDIEERTFTRSDTGDIYSSVAVGATSSGESDSTKVAPLSFTGESNGIPPEAQRVLSFYEKLGEENAKIVQLPLAAKRWDELSPMDQSNLTLLMNELTPSLETVEEAKAQGQVEFLERATASLDKSISLAERVAQGMNNSVERAKLNAMDISGNFIEAAFADTLTYSLEEGEEEPLRA